MPSFAHQGTQDGWRSRIRELIFGLEDSLVSTLGVVIGIAAGAADRRLILLSGIVLVAVEALSMAAGEFLSSKSHRELLEREILNEKEGLIREPDAKAAELRSLYLARGFTVQEADILVRRITANPALWLEEMTTKKLRIGAGELDKPRENAIVMFLSYLAGGVIPILPFALIPTISVAAVVAIIATGVSLFLLGFTKGKITGTAAVRSGREMVAVAGAAAVLGYAIGAIAGALFGIDVR